MQGQAPSRSRNRIARRNGKSTCIVCTGAECYEGAQELLAGIEDSFGVKPGETTLDGKLSVLTGDCVGYCALAPAVVLDNAVLGMMRPSEILRRLKRGIG